MGLYQKKKKKKSNTCTYWGGGVKGRESTFKGTMLSGNFKDLLTLATVTGNYICFCLRKRFNNIPFLEYCINSWHAAFRCFKGAISLFWDPRAQEGEYITGNTGACETCPILTTVGAFSAVAIPVPSQRLKCPQALTEAQVAFHSWSDPAQHHWKSTSRVETSTLR